MTFLESWLRPQDEDARTPACGVCGDCEWCTTDPVEDDL